jgi:hypothetical protein
VNGQLDCGDGVVLELMDITVHRRDGRAWISWPARPLLHRDGHALRDENGRARYSAPLVRPADRAVAARIEGAVLAAVRRAHPEVFDEREAAR